MAKKGSGVSVEYKIDKKELGYNGPIGEVDVNEISRKEGKKRIRKIEKEVEQNKNTREERGGKMKVTYLDPASLEIPDVRITSQFDDEILSMFKDDIKKTGITTPLIIAHEGNHYYVVDGMHRLEEAKLNNYKRVPCVIQDMSPGEMQLRNLVLNRLRGRTKASEEVMVIKDLFDNHGYKIEDITKRTGMRRERIEQLLSIGSCAIGVLEALDEDRIKTGHAYQLARLPDATTQLKILHHLYISKMKVTDLKDVIDDILITVKRRNEEVDKHEVLLAPPIPTATCSLCEQHYPAKDCVSPILCKWCYGVLLATLDQIRRESAAAQIEVHKKAEGVMEMPATSK